MKTLTLLWLVCGAIAACLPVHAAPSTTTPVIPVVHTWGDLEDAPAYTVVPTPRVTKEGDVPYHVPPKLPPVDPQLDDTSDRPSPKSPPTFFSETSNRIEFIYSGDAAHPQK